MVGGGCATKEVAAPGFRHNFHSNFHGIIHMGPVYRDLELERYGATYVWPENQFGHVFPDGRALVCSRDLDTTVERIARFSKRDADTFREVAQVYLEVLRDGFIPAMFAPPGPPSGDLAPLEGSSDGLGLIRQFLTAPNHVARDLFESPEVQTWVGFWVAQLAGTGDVFGLGANYPVMVAGSMEPYGWAICEGGSNHLAQAMASFLRDHGGEIRLDSPVARIEVDGDGARSVKLEDGTAIPVEGTLISNEPRPEAHVPRPRRRGRARRDDAAPAGGGGTTSCRCSVSTSRSTRRSGGRRPSSSRRCSDASPCRSASPGRARRQRERLPARGAAASAGCSRCTRPCSTRRSARRARRRPSASRSRRTSSATAARLRGRGSRRSTRPWCSTAGVRTSRGLEPEAIVGRYISSPIDIERVMPSMRNGDWNHGEMSQDQLGVFRPFHEYPPYRTGFSNVYLCGASTHPGGSIGGACGYRRRRSSPRTKGSTCGGKAEQSSRAALKAPLRVDRYGNVHRS